MRERQERQTGTVANIATYLRATTFTDARVLHLKIEVLAHDERIQQLLKENRSAKSTPKARLRERHVSKDTLREDQLLPLSRRGRKLSRMYPELEGALKVPHKNASAAKMAAAAERIADALTPHLKMLIKAKYPRNCLEVLRQDARTLREQADAARASRALLNRSNRELTEELSLARATIDELDAVLRGLDDYKTYKYNWEYCNRVAARMGRPSKRRLAARKRSAARRGARDERRPID